MKTVGIYNIIDIIILCVSSNSSATSFGYNLYKTLNCLWWIKEKVGNPQII